jgi:nucleotide-binding universal stress UspA family protein
MDTLLLPTDFSATALNAGKYALQLAAQVGASKLVLYHSYEIPVTIDPMTPGLQMLDVDALKTDSEQALENFKLQLVPFAKNITLSTFNEYGALTDGLDEVCKKQGAGLVVMGITGGGVLEERLIGSNTVEVAKHTNVPVIIVPATAAFTPVEEIMLTSDFDKSDKTIPVELVRRIVRETKAKLFVFNIEEDVDEYAAEYPGNEMKESYALHELLNDLKPEFHFSENTNFVDAVNEFAAEYGVDLIITIPKKHGFFGSLFAESHTKKLAFHSKVPVMVIH